MRIQNPFNPEKFKIVWGNCDCPRRQQQKSIAEAERKMNRDQMEKVYRHNIMNDMLKTARFETFIIRPGTEQFYRETKRFADNFSSKKTGLLGFGDPGNGKSHLFASIHHQLYEEGHVSLFIDCSRLFTTVEEAKKFSSKISINDIVNAAIRCDLLTLDELGAGKLTEEEFNDVLFPIINGRQGKLTNYTTNLNIDELQKWFEKDKYGKPLDDKGRLIDRILGSCEILQNEGKSYRLEMAMRRMEESA